MEHDRDARLTQSIELELSSCVSVLRMSSFDDPQLFGAFTEDSSRSLSTPDRKRDVAPRQPNSEPADARLAELKRENILYPGKSFDLVYFSVCSSSMLIVWFFFFGFCCAHLVLRKALAFHLTGGYKVLRDDALCNITWQRISMCVSPLYV